MLHWLAHHCFLCPQFFVAKDFQHDPADHAVVVACPMPLTVIRRSSHALASSAPALELTLYEALHEARKPRTLRPEHALGAWNNFVDTLLGKVARPMQSAMPIWEVCK